MANEIKQTVIDQQTIAANRPARKVRVRIDGFKGSYNGVFFDDKGQSREKVSTEFINKFQSDFPDKEWSIVEIADNTPEDLILVPGATKIDDPRFRGDGQL